MEKRIVCLANSWKNQGRCVAGIDLNSREWVRPVNFGGSKLYKSQIKNQYGDQPQVLDVINIPLKSREPLYYQPENYILDPDNEWQLEGRFNFNYLSHLSCNGSNICLDCDFFNNNFDSIAAADFIFKGCKDSLALIRPQELKIKKKRRPQRGAQIRGEFWFGEKYYNLAITDDRFKSPFYNRNNGLDEYGYYELNTNEVYLTISLGEELNKKHYKLIAAVIINGNYNFNKLY